MATTSDVDVDRKALLVPAAAPLYETLAPFAYTLIRIALGLFLVPHGFAKLFQGDAVAASRNFVNFGWAYPLAWAYFIGALEFFGGLMLAVGLFTRVVAAAFVIEMAVISFGVPLPELVVGQARHGIRPVHGHRGVRHPAARRRPLLARPADRPRVLNPRAATPRTSDSRL